MNSRWLLFLTAGLATFAAGAIDFPVEGKTGKAIQCAIDAAAAAGGGRVVVAPGEYPSGTLTLKSNVELHLEKGAVVVGSTNRADYSGVPVKAARLGTALICAWNAENISITGEGAFDMRGELYFDKTKKWQGKISRFYQPKAWRTKMLAFYRCKNVRFRDTSFLNAPSWTMHIKFCENLDFRRIKVINDLKFINADGIDFDSCRHVYVDDSDFLTGDDCIIMRAIREKGSNEKAIIEDVLVENCRLESACQCVRVGCPSDDTIRNVRFRNITMKGHNGINFDYPALYLSPSHEGLMDIHDVTFENVTGELGYIAVRINCAPGVKIRGVRDVMFRNFDVKSAKPLVFLGNFYSKIERIRRENFTLNGERLPDGEFVAECTSLKPLRRQKPGEYNYKPPVPYVPPKYVNVESADVTAIQKAVDEVAANETGGRVTVMRGECGSGRIELHSNVEVRLEKGVVVKAAFVAKGAKNIALTGPGTLDHREGDGRALDFADCTCVRLDGLTILCNGKDVAKIEKCDDVAADGIVVRDAAGRAGRIDFVGCGMVRTGNCNFAADQVASPVSASRSDPYDYKELVTREVRPVKVAPNAAGHAVADFGRDAVGWLELDGEAAGPFEVVIGELCNIRGEVTNEYPQSNIRCQRLKGEKPAGRYRVPMPPDRFNLKGYAKTAPAILLPDRFGIVFPFRYAEVVAGPRMEMRQIAVNYPIDMGKSAFSCDDANLVRVYDFCKYSILATSFCGVYVDGDRERTPYEADAYINQLDHYAMDDDYSLARKSHEWLMDHATWPTEWRQHSIKMAWADWMWTGDTRSLAKFYDALAGDKLMDRYARASDGLLETGGERRKGAKPGAADIVDWPAAERDGFCFTPVNAVVNAFYYRNLLEMADIARALGKSGDAAKFAARAKSIYEAYQKTFFRPGDGLYADGDGTDHCSLHANAAALAFGLVPDDRKSAVVAFLERKGMACSVYFAQYLLEAFCEAGRADIALRLITAKGDRGWLGMMDFGSTVSMEAWNVKAKPNLDLNHAWGAPPLNIISRYILGVTPLEPGFSRIAIRPQLGGLKRVSATVPTAAGPVVLEITPEKLVFTAPAPVEATFGGATRTFPAGRHEMAAGK